MDPRLRGRDEKGRCDEEARANETGILGRAHAFPIRVYYPDTDAGGVVYHATYLHFADRARSEFLRAVGWPVARLVAETGLSWVVRRAALDLMRPARLDDALTVVTEIVSLHGASLDVRQTILRGGEELARLDLLLALVTASGRPKRMPSALARDLLPFDRTSRG
jgi:acyl-CoA thioester hydrolase